MNSTYEDWLTARENARYAIANIEEEGKLRAEAEAAYYSAKAQEYARLLADNPATAAAAMVKGQADVASRLLEFRMREATYKAACQAAQLFTNEEAHTYQEHRIAMSGDSER